MSFDEAYGIKSARYDLGSRSKAQAPAPAPAPKATATSFKDPFGGSPSPSSQGRYAAPNPAPQVQRVAPSPSPSPRGQGLASRLGGPVERTVPTTPYAQPGYNYAPARPQETYAAKMDRLTQGATDASNATSRYPARTGVYAPGTGPSANDQFRFRSAAENKAVGELERTRQRMMDNGPPSWERGVEMTQAEWDARRAQDKPAGRHINVEHLKYMYDRPSYYTETSFPGKPNHYGQGYDYASPNNPNNRVGLGTVMRRWNAYNDYLDRVGGAAPQYGDTTTKELPPGASLEWSRQ